jgi:hypothetical protein
MQQRALPVRSEALAEQGLQVALRLGMGGCAFLAEDRADLDVDIGVVLGQCPDREDQVPAMEPAIRSRMSLRKPCPANRSSAAQRIAERFSR